MLRAQWSQARRRVGVVVTVAGLVLTGAGFLVAQPASADASITSSGPLTNITISPTLNCAVNHTGDEDGEWYSDTACGTFVALGGATYGPDDVPAGPSDGNPDNYHAFTPVSQTGVTGTGSASSPYKIVTVVDAGTTGLRLTETDTYVVGQETYRTDVSIANAGAAKNITAYRAGDCYLQNSDRGFGNLDNGGAVTCRAAADPSADTPVPGNRIEQLLPLTPGSQRQEAFFDDIWTVIQGGGVFDGTCVCNDYLDNGIGLSWLLTAPANGTTSIANLTSFSPSGVQPMSTAKTADSGTVAPGGSDGYTITVNNPNSSPQTLNSISDTLPSGFTYKAGSTSGVTTSNPTVNGQTLTWTGPFNVPANNHVTLHFNVNAPCTTGTYRNNAGADGGSTAVAPTGDTAPVNVTGAPTGTCAGGTTTTTTGGGGGTTTTTTGGGGGGGTTTTTTGGGGGTTTTTTTTTRPTATTSSTRPTTTSTSTSSTTPGPQAVCDQDETAATVSPPSAKPGGTVTVSDGCFAPNQQLSQTFQSDPVFLGNTTSDGNGRYSQVVTIPLGAEPGIHRIVTVGPGANGHSHTSVGLVNVRSLNCSDFTYQEDAQAVLAANPSDPHHLDSDHDGKACQALPSRVLGGTITTVGALPRTGAPESLRLMMIVAGGMITLGGLLVAGGSGSWTVLRAIGRNVSTLFEI